MVVVLRDVVRDVVRRDRGQEENISFSDPGEWFLMILVNFLLHILLLKFTRYIFVTFSIVIIFYNLSI